MPEGTGQTRQSSGGEEAGRTPQAPAAAAARLEPETVLREVVRLNGEALSNVGIVLVAILRHADVAAQQRGGRLANLLCEVLPRVVL